MGHRCSEYDSDYHLLANFDPHAKSYLTSRLDAAAAAASSDGSGAGTSLMAWVGARRETNFGQGWAHPSSLTDLKSDLGRILSNLT